ncbi:hypothetical protein R3P38DRAFT_3179572 [Favolaschia claudopus]|uniref:Uncharacterized protein n=1 Tax=Favolaschia claudopus TaxID=2862362 RepID=A0AAW0CST4_9AGAR
MSIMSNRVYPLRNPQGGRHSPTYLHAYAADFQIWPVGVGDALVWRLISGSFSASPSPFQKLNLPLLLLPQQFSAAVPFKPSCIPMFTQSDPGNENNAVANAQTLMRQRLDASLVGTLQHRWKTKKNNVKSEANWSVMRGDLAPGLEDLFEMGVQNDVGNPIEHLVFHWIAIPFVQVQLDFIPELLRTKPGFYGIVDFKVCVSTELLMRWRLVSHHPTTKSSNLYPRSLITGPTSVIYYEEMGQPEVTHATFWDVSESAPGSPASSSQYIIPQEMIPKASFRLFGGMEGEREGFDSEGADQCLIFSQSCSIPRSLADFDFKDKGTGMKE